MAVEPEDDELILDQEAEEQSDDQDQDQQDQEQASQDEGDEVLEVVFGDEAAPASGESETPLIKHLRSALRDKQRENEELRKAAPRPQPIEVGEKPTLSGCEYDEEAYEQQLDAWKTRKAQAEAAEADQTRVQTEANEAWQRDLQAYRDKRAELKFPDVEEAEETVAAALNQVQQAVVVKVADNPALVLYSLGKHPAKLADLSKITDPLKLAAAVAKLEGGLKVTARRPAPDPEQIARGSASVAKGKDATLERLEKEADRTGNRTELIAYRRQKSQAR